LRPRANLREIVFATRRSTRKFANLTADARVSLLIDNRKNEASDFHAAVAVTVMGSAFEVPDADKGALLKLYLNKHPHLEDFVMSQGCALIRVQVDAASW
jgi:hypothetical protein